MADEIRTTAGPAKGETWIWQPDRPEFRSVLIVTQVTTSMVRAKPASGGRSFWNPTCHFVTMAQRATQELAIDAR